MAQVMPTDLSCVPRTLPTTPTTALSLINSTVVAGSFKSCVDKKPAGSAVASYRLGWKEGVRIGLIWGGIFVAVFLIFSMAMG